MTTTIARLVLAMLLLPATGGVFVLAFAALIRPGRPPSEATLLLLWAVVYAFVLIYWLALWRGSVRWTRERVFRTALATALCLIAGIVFGVGCIALNHNLPIQVVILVGGGIVPIVWVLATVVVWRESPVERLDRLSALAADGGVICPLCGYNLGGLRESRCPECGSSFTLDQLIAAQPQREQHVAEL